MWIRLEWWKGVVKFSIISLLVEILMCTTLFQPHHRCFYKKKHFVHIDQYMYVSCCVRPNDFSCWCCVALNQTEITKLWMLCVLLCMLLTTFSAKTYLLHLQATHTRTHKLLCMNGDNIVQKHTKYEHTSDKLRVIWNHRVLVKTLLISTVRVGN